MNKMMKKSVLILSMITIWGVTICKATSRFEAGHVAKADTQASVNSGIQFFQGTWDELLAEAGRQAKPIFVDVYTEWCGPCKLMDRDVFPRKDVGDVYNELFISYKVDAEKGEGPEIAGKYRVTGYPTFLYLTPDGNLIHRGSGYSADPQHFIGQANEAFRQVDNPYPLAEMEKDYLAGRMDASALKQYIARLSTLEMDTGAPVEAYFDSLTEDQRKQAEEVVFLLTNVTDPSSRVLPFLMENGTAVLGDDWGSLVDEKGYSISSRLGNLISTGFWQAIQAWDLEEAERFLGWFGQFSQTNEWSRDDHYAMKLRYFNERAMADSAIVTAVAYVSEVEDLTPDEIKAEDRRQFSEFMEPYLEGTADSTHANFDRMKSYMQHAYSVTVARKLLTASTEVYRAADDQASLARALVWIEKAMELVGPKQEDYHVYSSVCARLLYKLGQKERAISLMEQTISQVKTMEMSDRWLEHYQAELKAMSLENRTGI